jgi:hypothetical protein
MEHRVRNHSGQRPDVGGQKSDDRRQMTEGRMWIADFGLRNEERNKAQGANRSLLKAHDLKAPTSYNE